MYISTQGKGFVLSVWTHAWKYIIIGVESGYICM